MLSCYFATYAQIIDHSSPTGVTIYTWGNESNFPIMWQYFSHDLLKIVSESRIGNAYKLFVVTQNNKLFYQDNKLHNEFSQIYFDDEILDIKWQWKCPTLLTNSGIVYQDNYKNYLGNISSIKRVNFGCGIVIVKIACGSSHSIALDSQGKVYAWGNNQYGQLGLGNKKNKLIPKLVESLSSKFITQIACGEWFSVFVEKDTNMYTCGYNNNGPLGLGLPCSVHVVNPAIVNFNTSIKIRTVQCGSYHVVVLTYTNKVYVWGSCILGATGFNKQTFAPEELVIKEKINSIIMAAYASESGTIVVYDDTVYRCGYNWKAELGLGHRNNVYGYVLIPFFNNNKLAIIKPGQLIKSAS